MYQQKLLDNPLVKDDSLAVQERPVTVYNVFLLKWFFCFFNDQRIHSTKAERVASKVRQTASE